MSDTDQLPREDVSVGALLTITTGRHAAPTTDEVRDLVGYLAGVEVENDRHAAALFEDLRGWVLYLHPGLPTAMPSSLLVLLATTDDRAEKDRRVADWVASVADDLDLAGGTAWVAPMPEGRRL